MNSQDLVRHFGEKLGIDLAFEEGSCAFEADGSLIAIHDLPEIDTIVISGDLGEPPPERLENLYKTLLEANYLFRETSGSTISLDPETGRFSLCRVVLCQVTDDDSFFDAVERFVNGVESWSRLIGDFRSAASAAADDDKDTPSADVQLGTGGFMSV